MKRKSLVTAIHLAAGVVALLLLVALVAYAAPAGEPARSPAMPSAPKADHVLINEFIATPTSAEAIELYNPTSSDVDVGGWTIDWGYGSTTINAGQVVTAGEYLVIDDSNTGGISISNAGTVLSLKDGTLTVVDSVGYGDDGGCPKPIYNFSAGRSPNGADTDDDAVDWNMDPTPTMGAANDHAASALGTSAVRINEIMPNSVYDEEYVEFIELYNDSDAVVDIGGYMLQVDDDYYVPSGTTIAARGFYTISGATIHATAPYFDLDDDKDNLYLYDDTGARIDQVGWDGRSDVLANGESFQRIPDGASPYDGYSWTTSGGEVTLFQLPPTKARTNVRALTIAKDGPIAVLEGEVVTYTITFGNMAATDAHGVVISDELPADVDYAGFVTYTTDLTSTGTTPPTWDAGTIPSNTTDLTFTLRVTFTGPFVNRQVVTNVVWIDSASGGFDPVSATLETMVFTEATRIHDIQGAGHFSPYEGQLVYGVHGIVTVVRTKNFYMQDPLPDADEATSEGILVYTGSGSSVNVGDEVLVSGEVDEYYPGGYGTGNLSTTEIKNVTVVVSSTGNTPPAPIVIGTGGRVPPAQVIEDDATGDVNTTGIFDPDQDGIDFYESLEGMLLQVNDAVAVAGTSKYGEIAVVGDNGANAVQLTPRGGLVIQPDDFNPERIIIDDAIVSAEPQVVPGDSFNGPIIGVLDYSYGNFKLLNPVALPAITPSGLISETTTLSGTATQLTVATFNVENLDPGDAEFDALADEIVNHLQSPDIIALEEIQDNSGATDDGVVDASLTYRTLITAVQNVGGPTYDFRDIAPQDKQDGGQPGGNIRVGFLFRPDRVTFVDRGAATATDAVSVTMGASGVELTLSPGRIDPNNVAFNDSRKPLAGEFLFNGHKLIVVANHFNSKGGDDPLFGRVQPPVLASEVQRKQQAQVVNNFVDSILALDSSANVIVVGDLNDFQFSEPISDVLAADALTNLVTTLPITQQYTYIYDGNSQVLDHILVSDHLLNALPDIDIVHMNAEFPASVRPTDHDPVLARFWLPWRIYIPLVYKSE